MENIKPTTSKKTILKMRDSIVDRNTDSISFKHENMFSKYEDMCSKYIDEESTTNTGSVSDENKSENYSRTSHMLPLRPKEKYKPTIRKTKSLPLYGYADQSSVNSNSEIICSNSVASNTSATNILDNDTTNKKIIKLMLIISCVCLFFVFYIFLVRVSISK